MTKKALIENITIVHTYDDGTTGLRVAEVVDTGNEFDTVFTWVDCSDDITPDAWCYDESTNTFKKTDAYFPTLDANDQPFDLTTDNEANYTYDWENQHWVSV